MYAGVLNGELANFPALNAGKGTGVCAGLAALFVCRGCQKKVPTAGKVPYHTYGFTAVPELTASGSMHDGCLYNSIKLLLPEFHEH